MSFLISLTVEADPPNRNRCERANALVYMNISNSYSDRAAFLEGCVITIGGDYAQSMKQTMPIKISLRANSNVGFDEYLNALKAGLYSDTRGGHDRTYIQRAIELGRVANERCQEDPSWGTSPTTETSNFLDKCHAVIELKDIQLLDVYEADPNFGARTTVRVTTDLPTDDLNAAYTRCRSTDRPLLHCGMACITDVAQAACDQITTNSDTRAYYEQALECARNPKRTNPACVAICNVEERSCTDGLQREEDDDDENATGERVVSPVVPASVDPPTTPPGTNPDTSDSTGDSTADSTNDTTQQQNDIETAAARAAQDVFGNGNSPFQFERSNPSGSLDLPDSQIEGYDAPRGAFAPIKDPRGFQPVQIQAVSALRNMPRGGSRKDPGGKAKPGTRQGGPPGGGSPGGGPIGGGSAGLGGGAPPKGGGPRGAPVNQRLKAIADGLGGNRFMSADGAKGNNNSPRPEIQKINPRLQRKITENNEEANKRALNAAFQNNLRTGQLGKDLFIKASYFPNHTELYLDLRQKSDLLNESGE